MKISSWLLILAIGVLGVIIFGAQVLKEKETDFHLSPTESKQIEIEPDLGSKQAELDVPNELIAVKAEEYDFGNVGENHKFYVGGVIPIAGCPEGTERIALYHRPDKDTTHIWEYCEKVK